MRSVTDDVIVQTACEPAFPVAERPAIGGIVLWKDNAYFLRVDRGCFGPDDILFSGHLKGQQGFFGRGRLSLNDTAGSVYLRLERIGARVRALCSADGSHWFTVGDVDLSAADPLQVGVFAVGTSTTLSTRQPIPKVPPSVLRH